LSSSYGKEDRHPGKKAEGLEEEESLKVNDPSRIRGPAEEKFACNKRKKKRSEVGGGGVLTIETEKG